MKPWPEAPDGDMVPILAASIAAVEATRQYGEAVDAMVVTTDGAALTAADRCDKRCPAAAAFRLRKLSMELDLCAHHWRDNEKVMSSAGWKVVSSVEFPVHH